VICFRVGPADAEILGPEFHPGFSTTDLTNLPNHAIYLRLMIDGAVSSPFSAETVTAAELPMVNRPHGDNGPDGSPIVISACYGEESLTPSDP
jgi:hypothetical protein